MNRLSALAWVETNTGTRSWKVEKIAPSLPMGCLSEDLVPFDLVNQSKPIWAKCFRVYVSGWGYSDMQQPVPTCLLSSRSFSNLHLALSLSPLLWVASCCDILLVPFQRVLGRETLSLLFWARIAPGSSGLDRIRLKHMRLYFVKVKIHWLSAILCVST